MCLKLGAQLELLLCSWGDTGQLYGLSGQHLKLMEPSISHAFAKAGALACVLQRCP